MDGMDEPRRQACDNYTIDLTATNFGQCKCGLPKSAHNLTGGPAPPGRRSCVAVPGRSGSVSALTSQLSGVFKPDMLMAGGKRPTREHAAGGPSSVAAAHDKPITAADGASSGGELGFAVLQRARPRGRRRTAGNQSSTLEVSAASAGHADVEVAMAAAVIAEFEASEAAAEADAAEAAAAAAIAEATRLDTLAEESAMAEEAAAAAAESVSRGSGGAREHVQCVAAEQAKAAALQATCAIDAISIVDAAAKLRQTIAAANMDVPAPLGSSLSVNAAANAPAPATIKRRAGGAGSANGRGKRAPSAAPSAQTGADGGATAQSKAVRQKPKPGPPRKAKASSHTKERVPTPPRGVAARAPAAR